MQSLDPVLAERLRQAGLADVGLMQKFMSKAGDLAVSLVVAAIILAVTLWAAGWASRLVRRILARANRLGTPDVTLQSFGGSLARYVVIIVGLIAVLQQLGVQTTSILAVLGAASLAIGLALQGALSNVAAGVMLLLFRPYRVGDVVEIAGRTGTVRALDLFTTELATLDNVKVVFPNGKVFGDVIVNTSFHERRRVDVVFRVDVKKDLATLLDALRARAVANPRVLDDPAPVAEITALSEAFVEVAVRAWALRDDYGMVKSDLLLVARLLNEGSEAIPPLPEPRPAPPPVPKRKPALRLGKREEP